MTKCLTSVYVPIFVLILSFTAVKELVASQLATCNVPNSELENSPYPFKTSPQNLESGRLAIFEKGQLWPTGRVYFSLDEKLSNDQISMVYEAFSEFHSKTCIQFKPWRQNYTRNYVTITASENGACSLSEVCMKGGQQFVQLGGLCWFKEMIIHQLGHTLCLGHEHQRPIRDWYLSYKYSCPENEIPAKLDDNEGQLGFYDYASQMHFACGWCSGGWPRNESVTTKCGYQATHGLSLLDADYINLLYGCGGCRRHRWVPVDKLSTEQKERMHSFGFKDRLGHPLYPCRVSFGGEIVIGKFTWNQEICSFSLGGKEHYQTGAGTEVLVIPGGLKSEDGRSEYKVEQVTAYPDDKLLKLAVPAGRLSEKEDYGVGYIAYGRVRSPSEKESEDVIGKAWERDGRIPQAFFPLGGQEVSAYYFKVLTCHDDDKQEQDFTT